jgi:hypothetical protein
MAPAMLALFLLFWLLSWIFFFLFCVFFLRLSWYIFFSLTCQQNKPFAF